MNSIQDCNTQMLSDRGEWTLIGPLGDGEPQELTIRSKAGMGRKVPGRSGACEAESLPFVRRSVIGRFRPKSGIRRLGGDLRSGRSLRPENKAFARLGFQCRIDQWHSKAQSNGPTQRGTRSRAVQKSARGAITAMLPDFRSAFAACRVIRSRRVLTSHCGPNALCSRLHGSVRA